MKFRSHLLQTATPALMLVLAACSSSPVATQPDKVAAASTEMKLLPGMPPIPDPNDIYAATKPGMLADAVKNLTPRIYVPNSRSDTVTVIDPATYKIVGSFPVGREPQHVTPSYDMKTLWALNDLGDTLSKIDPVTGKKIDTIKVMDPYNMYYTPNGKYAIVVAERLKRLDFYEPSSMKLDYSLPVPCKGVDHMDFTADGRFLIASCEFSGQLVKVDVEQRKVVGTLTLPLDQGTPPSKGRGRMHHGGRMPIEADRMPQDVKTSPDGKLFYVADMMADGVHLIEPNEFKYVGFIATGLGAHGLYPSRDSKVLYCSNRDEGSVAVISFAEKKVIAKWKIEGGGSPDMGGVSADGKVLWLAGRWHDVIYAFDTNDGKVLAKIKVDKGPHGLCVYPQPGRYSLGHTGVFR
jgi:YVTN family beta-propeller protein